MLGSKFVIGDQECDNLLWFLIEWITQSLLIYTRSKEKTGKIGKTKTLTN